MKSGVDQTIAMSIRQLRQSCTASAIRLSSRLFHNISRLRHYFRAVQCAGWARREKRTKPDVAGFYGRYLLPDVTLFRADCKRSFDLFGDIADWIGDNPYSIWNARDNWFGHASLQIMPLRHAAAHAETAMRAKGSKK